MPTTTTSVPEQNFLPASRQFTLITIDPTAKKLQLSLSRVNWDPGAIGEVFIECALDGVRFVHQAGVSLAGGNRLFKGVPAPQTAIFTDLPGIGLPDRQLRITFSNVVALTTALVFSAV